MFSLSTGIGTTGRFRSYVAEPWMPSSAVRQVSDGRRLFELAFMASDCCYIKRPVPALYETLWICCHAARAFLSHLILRWLSYDCGHCPVVRLQLFDLLSLFVSLQVSS